jgi:hypothetical protein
VVEDVIITEEALEVLVVEEVPLQEEKETLPQDVKVLVVDSEATEVLLQEKVVVLDLEVILPQERVVFQIELQELMLQDVKVVHQKDQLDVLKTSETLQEKEDQEEANTFC